MADARLIITAVDEASKAISGLTNSVEGFVSKVKGLAGGVTIGYLAKEFVETADAMTLVNARLKLVTGSTEEFNKAREEAYRIAQTNNLGLQETAQLYTKLAEPIKRLGGETKEVSGIVEAFASSLRVGGASTQEASAATLQFAQAMASGKLNGDEFRSLAEASPRFMRALADGMGVPIERLKEMSKEGKLTADVVGNALLKELSSLKDEAGKLPDTVGGAFQRMKNDAMLFVEEVNTATGTTGELAEIIGTSSGLLREFSNAVGTATGELQTASGQFDLVGAAVGAVGVVVETLVVLFANVAYVAKTTAQEIGVWFAQAKAYLSGNAEEARRLGEAWTEQAAANRRAIDKFSEGVVGATGRILQQRDALKNHTISASENSNEIQRLAQRSGVASGEFAKLSSRIGDTTAQQKAAEKAAKDYEKAADAVMALTSKSLGVNTDYIDKLQQLELWYSKNRDKTDQYVAAVIELIKQQDSSKEAAKRVEEQEKAVAKALEATREGLEKSAQAYRDETAKIDEKAISLELEARQLGLTKEAQAALTQEQRNAEIVRLQALVTSDMVLLAGQDEIDNINARIAALQRLNSAEGNLAAKGAMLEASQKTRDSWKETSSQIENALTQAMVDGFTNGKSIATSVGTWLKNYFLTNIARSIAQALTGALMTGLSGVAQAMGGSGDLIANLFGGGGGKSSGGGASGGIGDLLSLGSSLFGSGGLGGSLLAGAGWLTGATTLGGSLAAAGSLIGTGSLSGIMAGIGMGAGALGPIALGAYALYSLLTRDKRSPAQQQFGFVNAAGVDVASEGFYDPVVKNGGVSADFTQVLQGISRTVSETVKDLGGTLNDQIRYGLFTSVSPDNLGGQVVANVVTPTGDLYTFNENGPNETVAARLAAQSPAMIAAALKASDFDDRVDAIFAALSNTPTAMELQAAVEKARDIVSPAEEETSTATVETAETVNRIEPLISASIEAQNTMIDVLRDVKALLEATQTVLGDGFVTLRDQLQDLNDAADSVQSTMSLQAVEPA